MSEAKYKVGQVMSLPIHSHPLPIAEVVVCYRFVKEIGALWREEELTPYVKPFGVGDRVRWKDTHKPAGVILLVGGEQCCIDPPNNSWLATQLRFLERIPTEAGQ